ncbi:c-type cytochrome [Stutzerimonas kunmingensis]|uniref:c-type cytochrome n=1 Tax=Stutzerimonas kunmingensis TaxID=1211807 RepID=UPI0028AD6ABF|nr:c-type cytochrome [Stutzerimonas kunmingensis]
MKLTHWPLVGVAALLLTMQAQAADGQKIYAQGGANPAAMACGTCHGADAMGMAAAGFPRLAGISAGYTRKQLEDFRSGARSNPVMQPIAAALSDEEMDAVAAMLEARPAPVFASIGRAEKAEGVGPRLALRGAWERNIPECVACHGPAGIGVGESFPPLAGQSTQYLSAQLNAWRQGTRKNDPNDLMGHIARAMTDDEVQAVAEYFAGLEHKGGSQ